MSHEFESDDLERAESAGYLVGFYCDEAPSEAQMVGCLANATEDQVCERDTQAKREAVDKVDDFAADPCDRDKYEPGKP